MAEYEQTLCWECKNTNRHKCSWFNPVDPQPVPGWVAELRPKARIGESYMVKECPNFDPEPKREVQKPFVPVSGVTGVTWDAEVHRWEARIQGHGKKYYLGRYSSLVEAIAARKAAERAIARGEEPRGVTAVRSMGYPGVYRGKRSWTARITHKGVKYYLGYFKTEEKAIAARKAAEEAIKRGEIPAH
jgi:hypothetical protein